MRDALRLALDRQEDVKPVGVRCTTAKLCNPWPGPVSPYTVARELGHGGEAMVRRAYGHLGTGGTVRRCSSIGSNSTLSGSPIA